MRTRTRLAALLLPGLLAVLGGCRSPTKTLILDSEPSGATVWINGERQASVTPVRVPFEWYGAIEVRLEKSGYESVAQDVEIPTEIDGYPIIDLALLPFAKDKTYRRTLRMAPIGTRPVAGAIDRVRQRSEAFRARALREKVEPGTPTPSPDAPLAR